MNIMKLGAIGELVGGVAVVATLIYLAVQVRQARHEVTFAGIQARADAARAVLPPLVGDDALRDADPETAIAHHNRMTRAARQLAEGA